MGETFTNLNALTNQAQVKEVDVHLQENLEADDVIFYHAIRAELDLLKKNPQPQTVHNILNYSKSLR
ncbi:hypothetical protein FPZ43_15245 [Mucilaginibacter pallidiroseus]|uniref:Uncharacterized protein n=1 Tax=Mucilaginibacter pallidiroseus TaxID=2599295 RepID=A0A563U598_9SPHI|nr:hypothetical protein [Mucilaginibacter pallidiroseus]TWR26508.1 hypothetical protein FPZ43_15245 [Mucilaginibacter pallidiroseus]